jgi:hypothetical protein
MSKPNRILLAACLGGLVAFHATPASASVAYLSRTGTGSCALAAPCGNMPAAIAFAGAGGEVICLDKGSYGGFSSPLTFSITISCGDGLWEAPSGLMVITTPAGADVVIEGLVTDSATSPGTIMSFNGQGSLHLRRVRIGNAPTSSGPAHGLSFTPTGPANLFVSDSYFYNMGSSGIAAAILISPGSGVTANVSIESTRIEKNIFGIIADGSGGGIIRGVMSDSFVLGNKNNGITVASSGTNVVLAIDNVKVAGNNFGLVATGTNAGMLVHRSFIIANATGLFTASGGVLFSYRDNSLNANTTTDGVFTGAVGLQ